MLNTMCCGSNKSCSRPNHLPVPVSPTELSGRQLADDLCDELTLHTFECEDCINGREEACVVFASLQKRIAAAGGPKKSFLLTM